MALLPEWSLKRVPVVGMVHLPPLPDSPRWSGDLQAVRDFVRNDAKALCQGGVDGIMLENFGDVPFYPDRVPAVTVAVMTMLAHEIRLVCESTTPRKIPFGINVLRNDGRSALAVALASGASFIRVNVMCGARVTDQGILQGIAHDLLRERAMFKAHSVRILADVDVKHSAPLAARELGIEVRDVIDRALADAVIVSGHATGGAINSEDLGIVKSACRKAPVFIGSGVTIENAGELIRLGADGLIVGTSLKFDGVVDRPVDQNRVRILMEKVNQAESTVG